VTGERWRDAVVAPRGDHHLVRGEPIYSCRFDAALPFHAPGLAPVRRGAEAWHIDENGTAAYERRFRQTFGFYDERAAVEDDGGWCHVDVRGAPVYADRHAWCGNFQEARCTVRTAEGRYRHIMLDGAPVYPGTWKYAGDYRDGIAVVQADDGRSTHVDGRGRLIYERWFEDLDVFHKGYARARDAQGWHHLDRSGGAVYERRFAMVEPFYNGQARVERFDGGLEIIDETGRALLELRATARV
jgi:hypothetical protein